MMEFEVKKPVDFCFGAEDCPVYNVEFMCCNITHEKCPTYRDDGNGDYLFDLPANCPAKQGIEIKTE